MRELRFKSLTMRIWTTFTAVILVIICSISIVYLVAYRTINEANKMQDLKVFHDAIIDSENFIQPNRFDELRNLRGSEHFIAKVSSSGDIKIESVRKISEKFFPQNEGNVNEGNRGIVPPGIKDEGFREWMATFAKGDMTESEFKEYFNNRKYIFVISSIKTNASENEYLISFTPNSEDNIIIYIVMFIGLIFIGIGFFTAKVVANRISKPLKELENHTVRIAQKDWKEPIIIKSEDEIGRLAKAMNLMQIELKRIDEEEKTFLQSISHDLKTPVMVIMSHAEAIIDGVYIDSVEKTAEIIKEEAISLEKKIKQLLYLNTLDYVLGNNIDNEEFDLKEVLLKIINRFEVVNSNLDWELDLDRIIIKGNKEKVKVAIENILENGLRYAKSQIRVKLKKEGSYGVLELYNDGSNIPEDNIEHIFETLYKDKTGNFGLGLAISKKIVDFYGGSIRAVNRENGVSFIIKYPI